MATLSPLKASPASLSLSPQSIRELCIGKVGTQHAKVESPSSWPGGPSAAPQGAD